MVRRSAAVLRIVYVPPLEKRRAHRPVGHRRETPSETLQRIVAAPHKGQRLRHVFLRMGAGVLLRPQCGGRRAVLLRTGDVRHHSQYFESTAIRATARERASSSRTSRRKAVQPLTVPAAPSGAPIRCGTAGNAGGSHETANNADNDSLMAGHLSQTYRKTSERRIRGGRGILRIRACGRRSEAGKRVRPPADGIRPHFREIASARPFARFFNDLARFFKTP